MEKVFGQDDPKIAKYVEDVFKPEDSVLREIRQRSLKAGLPEIQVGSIDSLHLEVLARGFGARKIVEIGTLGGYSGVCLCRALPSDGKLYTFEFSPHHAEVAKESFKKAGFSNQVEIFVGPAVETLPSINKQGPFDLVFIDADKQSYPRYFEWAAENLRKGGAILADNTFAWGMIADEKFEDRQDETQVKALREFNHKAATDPRFKSTILPTGEGLTLAVKIK